jgi:hypothetical protein
MDEKGVDVLDPDIGRARAAAIKRYPLESLHAQASLWIDRSGLGKPGVKKEFVFVCLLHEQDAWISTSWRPKKRLEINLSRDDLMTKGYAGDSGL